jgi:hypothetical protein
MFESFKNFFTFSRIKNVFELGILIVIVFAILPYITENKPKELRDFKDGIQNHLTWSIKGECFFVRPNDNVTVYLIRVPDCDKK